MRWRCRTDCETFRRSENAGFAEPFAHAIAQAGYLRLYFDVSAAGRRMLCISLAELRGHCIGMEGVRGA